MPLNGSCGAAAKVYEYNETSYSGSLCASGSSFPASPSFPGLGSSINWICQGSGGGSNISCNASRKSGAVSNGICGSLNGTSVNVNSLTSSSIGLCSSGANNYFQLFTDGNYWWKCSGLNGGSDSDWCIANVVKCGAANGGSYSSAPTALLCAYGNASTPILQSGQWKWICSGGNTGGTTASCYANRVDLINGSCGAAAKVYEYNETSYSGSLCASGSSFPASPSFPGLGSSINWICQGSGGGSNISCNASRKSGAVSNGICGSLNGTSVNVNSLTSSSIGLCSSGANNYFQLFTDGNYWWKCSGLNGGSDSDWCIANVVKCGAANGGSYSSAPTALLCAYGNASTPILQSGQWKWICSGGNTGGTTASCYANRVDLINGSCGAAAKVYEYNETSYSGSLCASGSSFPASPSFPGLGSSINWICQGSGGGSNISCNASRKSGAVSNGICGSLNGTSVNVNSLTSSSIGLCSSGANNYFQLFTDGNYWWKCSGLNGGSDSDWCIANVVKCGAANGGSYSSAPTALLCAYGNASTPILQSGQWKWICSGGNTGGTTASCYANRVDLINGSCGAAAKVYEYNETSYSGSLCASGSSFPASPSFPGLGSSINWICQGSGGGSNISCNASRKSGAVSNGICGSLNGTSVNVNSLTSSSIGLCSSGANNYFQLFTDGNYWWKCSGLNGGSDSDWCIANVVKCGAANGGSYSSAPTALLCAYGNASTPILQSGQWKWICSGGNTGGTTASCYANRVDLINGSCGAAAKVYEYNETSYSGSLCASGSSFPASPSFPGLGSSINWICQGSGGGSNISCNASRKSGAVSNGICGSLNGTSVNVNSLTSSSIGLCSSGANNYFQLFTDGNYWWKCSGLNGGSDSDWCIANVVKCGAANGGSYSSAPTALLCAYGNASTPILQSGQWKWICSGGNTGGTTASCYANQTIGGTCGTAAKTYAYNATAYTGSFCNTGTSVPSSPAFPSLGSAVTWLCEGVNGGNYIFCMAKRDPAPINGVCGSSHKSSYVSAYTKFDLCSAGTPSDVLGTGPWTWTCTGSNGGTTASCYANKIVEGACGSAAKTYAYNATAYTGSFCNTGTSVPATPTFPVQGATINWICNGLYGGGYVLCDAKRGAPGACGSAVRTFAYNETSYGTYSQCSTGTPSSTTFPSQGGSTSWTCSGINGGPASTTCTASRANAPQTGACGSAAKTYAYNATAYTGSFCNTGTSVPATPTFPTQGATINWICNGLYGGGYVLCDAKRGAPGACGSAVRTFAYNETSYGTYSQCSTGTSSSTSFPSQGGSTSWTCSGINGGPASTTCTASRANAPQTGACGSAAKTYAYNATAYTGSFCNTGTSVPATPTFPVQGATINWICNGLYGGGYVICNAKRDNPPACVWTCNPWSLCINGTQSRSCSALPIGCVGSNPEVITRSCTNIVLNGFLNPLELVSKVTMPEQRTQCLWCDYYYQDGNVLALGKAGALDFRFVYNSPDGNMKKYEMAISASSANNPDSIPNSEKIVITRNISVASGQAVNINGISVSRTISKITGNTLPYDNKTYRWWVRVTNDKETSPWIEAVNKSIYIPDHQWPTPAIGGVVETRSSKNEFLGHTVCSTMISISNGEYQDDPCYQSCWSDYQKGTAPIVGDSRWKCSVCYSTNGSPKLCTNDAFEWGEVSSSIGTFNNTTNTYKEKNKLTGKVGNRKGRYFPNPIIKFIDPSSEDNKLKLKVMGSECPLEASVMAKLIRPVYIER
ncbi:hypothetical protein MNSC_11150 [Minisyncoccus archaeophilus]|uniref:hypothetical protein n=1 Tax=Minisyncoccus archaeiphilus TaxID=3238481 RepID=UPI00399C4EFA